MKKVRLDLSPMLINRTAAFNLCQDIREIALACDDLQVELQFFGHIENDIPSGALARRYVAAFFNSLSSPAIRNAVQYRPSEAKLDESASDTVMTFYVDPLYVLFADLRSTDYVTLLDLSPLTHPQWHNPVVGTAYLAALRKIVAVHPKLAAISQNTIDTFLANFGRYTGEIFNLPLYLPRFIRTRLNSDIKPLPSPWRYFLFVGSLEIRKNMISAIQAFGRSGLFKDGYRLLIIGGAGHGSNEIMAYASSIEGVIFAGYLSGDEICAAYQGATGFIYPSYLEGFGIPLLEAMSFGIPCVATFTGACPEVGGDVVVYADPDDIAKMATQLRHMAEMSGIARQELGSKLRSRVEDHFSFSKFTDNVRTILCD